MLQKYRLNAMLAAAAALCMLFTGCVSDKSPYAVAEARKYALKNLRGIPEDARHYIRYAKPVIYENLIFAQKVMPAGDQDHIKIVKLADLPVDKAYDKMHSCVVWNPPGLGASVVVAGTGERSMRLWTPIRAIVKNYTAPDAAFDRAMTKASEYAYDTLSTLSNAELDRTRFLAPDVRYTKFKLEAKPAEKEVEIDSRLKEDKPNALPPVQITLVWPADDSSERITVTGFATEGRFATWTPVTGGLTNASTLAKNTLSADEAEKLNLIQYNPAALVFPAEAPADRGNTEVEKESLFGPSIRMR